MFFEHYYIPHHAVTKKFQVVFDASAKTTNGRSFNDVQLTGPRLQDDLYDIMLRFRAGKIALTSDIKKMFRQVRITPEQWDLQRIIWRASPSDPLCEYWLTVVTYGMASSTYNAVKAMLQCANDNQREFPYGAATVKNSFYMDDMLASTHSTREAKKLCRETTEVLKCGGFELAKWISNDQDAVTGAMAQEVELAEDQSVASLLGLTWQPQSDSLGFKIRNEDTAKIVTKRVIASEGAKLYDPNGYLAPITVCARLFMQNLWRIGVEWDEDVGPEITKNWREYHHSLSELSKIQIPRWIGTGQGIRTQIHAFADASTKAYGAVLYTRTITEEGRIDTALLTAKSKLADMQTITIPRMELCAAKLATKIAQRVNKALGLKNLEVHF